MTVCGVSVLFNEPKLLKLQALGALMEHLKSFSALQRAEIAEILRLWFAALLNESFSALQRAEIAEIRHRNGILPVGAVFQCSSTSRNC